MSSVVDASSGASQFNTVLPGGAAAAQGSDVYSERRRYGILIGGQRLLLGSRGAVRVIEPGPVSRLPNTHRWFFGLTNIRSSMVPVYDLARRQALTVPDTGRMLLVLGVDTLATAVMIDRSPRNLLVPDTNSDLPSLPESIAGHAKQAFTIDEQVWTELDWSALFDELKSAAVMVRGEYQKQ